MKLYEYYSKSGFHTCLVTTFGVDFDTYENVVFSRARGAGCHNNLLIADGRMLTLALDGNSSLPHHAGRLYSVTSAAARGVFHPKVTLQLGRSTGRLIVSSANVTSAGLAGNLELGSVVECQAESSGERTLMTSAFRFATRFLDEHDPSVRHQLDWMYARTPWLLEDDPGLASVALGDGSRAALLASGTTQGIGQRFISLIGGERVERLIILSPYWDNDLAALRFLMHETSANEVFVLLDEERHCFPANALESMNAVKLIAFKTEDENRFIHAKLIIAQTAHTDHVLYGSANCTLPALGDRNSAGSNEEACLYRALPRDGAIERLGLVPTLESPPLDRDALPALRAEEPIPLAELASKYTGRFSCLFDTLTWHLPEKDNLAEAGLELLGADGRILPLSLQALTSETSSEQRYRLPSSDNRPYFARVRYADGRVSAPGVILVRDALRSAVRDARTKRIDVALAALDGETDIGLWLLETLGELEAAEAALRTGAPIKRQTVSRGPYDPAAAPQYAKLSYEAFVAGRHLRSDAAAIPRDSLSGTHFSYIRGFLNRILALDGWSPAAGDESGSSGLVDAFDLGDEVADAMKALEEGADLTGGLTPPPPDLKSTDLRALAELQLAHRRRSNRQQLIEAVENLQQRVPQKASAALSSVDPLRLRAMLMVIMAAAWDGVSKLSSSLQVLPASGDMTGAWPRLLGKCLFAYFGGTSPAIRKLVIEDFYDQIPDDILECWATCFWAIQAIIDGCSHSSEYRALTSQFQKLRASIYALTGLQGDEFCDVRIARTFDAFTERFAKSLKLKPDRLLANHKGAAEELSRSAAQVRLRPSAPQGE